MKILLRPKPKQWMLQRTTGETAATNSSCWQLAIRKGEILGVNLNRTSGPSGGPYQEVGMRVMINIAKKEGVFMSMCAVGMRCLRGILCHEQASKGMLIQNGGVY